MSEQPRVSVVVLNFNTASLLEKFLPHLLQTTYPNTEFVVADNGSSDNSIALVQEQFPSVRVIALETNLGFAGGYNEALTHIHSEYIVLLNSDVEVTPNWLEPMMNLMVNQPEIGAVQPKILDYKNRHQFEYAGASGGYVDRWIYPFCRGRLFDVTEEDHGQYNEAIPVFWATGAALLIRNQLYRGLGGLDREFFAHMEEIDLCWRLQNAGHEIWCCPSAVVYHVGGGTLSAQNSRKTFLNFRNNLALIVKNAHASEVWMIFIVRLILDGIAGMVHLKNGRANLTWAIVRAHFAFYVRIPHWLRKRWSSKKKHHLHDLKGVYPRSVVRDFFLRGKRTFSEIL